MASNYELRHKDTSAIDLPVYDENESEKDLSSSNSDFEQEKCKNCDNATFKCTCSSDSENNEPSCDDPACDNPACDDKKTYECKHCNDTYNCKTLLINHLLSEHNINKNSSIKPTNRGRQSSNQNDVDKSSTPSKIRCKISLANDLDDTISIDPVIVSRGPTENTSHDEIQIISGPSNASSAIIPKTPKNVKKTLNVKKSKSNNLKKTTPKRTWRTLGEKLEIIQKFEDGAKISKIASDKGMSWSSVKEIINSKQTLKTQAKSSSIVNMASLTRPRSRIMEKSERLLAIWVRDLVDRKFPLDTKNIQSQALDFFTYVKKNMPDKSEKEQAETFTASKGWFQKFRSRHDFHNVKMKGEAASADIEGAEKFILEFKNIIAEGNYSEHQIINVDETSKFYRAGPTKCFAPRDSEKKVSGTKIRKERVTLMVGGNASGDLKLKPLVIGKVETPHCFKVNKINRARLPVHYRFNKTAWMTKAIFRDWFANCFIPCVKNYCKSKNIDFKILLLLDNFSGHPTDLSHPNIKVMFLPPNTTSILQPCDQGGHTHITSPL